MESKKKKKIFSYEKINRLGKKIIQVLDVRKNVDQKYICTIIIKSNTHNIVLKLMDFAYIIYFIILFLIVIFFFFFFLFAQ